MNYEWYEILSHIVGMIISITICVYALVNELKKKNPETVVIFHCLFFMVTSVMYGFIVSALILIVLAGITITSPFWLITMFLTNHNPFSNEKNQ